MCFKINIRLGGANRLWGTSSSRSRCPGNLSTPAATIPSCPHQLQPNGGFDHRWALQGTILIYLSAQLFLFPAQNFIGSVICQCDDEGTESETEDDNMVEDGTIFGITSVLNLTAKKDQPSIAQLRTYILDRAKTHASPEVQQQLKEILDSEQRHVGFLINERFINIPAQISVPLLQSLQQEIEAAKAKKMKYDFGTLLLLVKFYRKESKKGKPGEDVYTNAEDELLSDRAKFSFEYSMASETDSGMSGDWLEGDAVMTPYRKLLVLEAKKLPQLIDDIQRFINGE